MSTSLALVALAVASPNFPSLRLPRNAHTSEHRLCWSGSTSGGALLPPRVYLRRDEHHGGHTIILQNQCKYSRRHAYLRQAGVRDDESGPGGVFGVGLY